MNPVRYIFIGGEWHSLKAHHTACGIAVPDKWRYALSPVAKHPHCQ